MLSKRDLYSVLFASVLLVMGLGVAFAQDGGSGAGSSSGGDTSSGTVPVRERAALSGAEQVEQARATQSSATSMRDRVMDMLDTARRERDIIRATCLNDKLSQVNANLETLQRRRDALQAAVERQDDVSRNHEYTVIAVLQQKFQVLEQEANQCIGQDIFETGSTRVVTDLSEEVPQEDPTEIVQPEDDSLPYIPPPASPDM